MAASMENKGTCSKENGPTNGTGQSRKKLKEMVLFAGVAGISFLGGFGMAFSRSKKKDAIFPDMPRSTGGKILESPTSLGFRALGWGTLISVSGVGLFCFTVYKFTGAKNLKEFAEKMQEKTPQIPKKEPTGRNEFSSLQDLADYCIKGGKG